MRIRRKCDDFEHINIEYEGGEITLRFREYQQTLKLFKKVDHYGEDRVVLSSSGWYEREYTIKRGGYDYFLMLCNGSLICIPKPLRDNDHGDECVVVKISNNEGMDVD
jgi:hypothetical protein